MKKFRLFSLLVSLAALTASFTACSEDDPAPAPQPEPPKAPTVTLTAGVATIDGYDFTVASTDAETVKYLYNKKSEAVPVADKVLAEGKAVEGQNQKVTLTGLDADTEYWVVAAAEGKGGKKLSDVLEFKTLAPEATVVTVAYKEESATDHSLVFTITPTNATKVRYHYVVKGEELPAADKVLENGSTAAADAASEVELNGLNAETTYTIFVVAEGEGGIVSATAEGTTLEGEVVTPDPIVFEAVSASAQISGGNYWMELVDADGLKCQLDFYADPNEPYLPTGDYEKKDDKVVPYIGIARFVYPDWSSKNFASGMANVEAIVENGELSYFIELDFVMEDGTPVIGGYEGAVEGISLDDAITMTLDNASRIEPNGEVPGEYYIKFDGGNAPYTEMRLDFFTDPAATDNGNAAMPAGTYTVSSDGTPNTVKPTVEMWGPDFNADIASGEVVVTVEGDIYTFDISLTGADADATKIKGVYTGRVTDMVRAPEEVEFMFTQVMWAGVEKPADDVPYAEFFLFNDDMSQVAQFKAYHPSFATEANPYLVEGLWPVINRADAKLEQCLIGAVQIGEERYECEASNGQDTFFGVQTSMPGEDNSMISFRLRAVSESGKVIIATGGYMGPIYSTGEPGEPGEPGDELETYGTYRMNDVYDGKTFTLEKNGTLFTLKFQRDNNLITISLRSTADDIAPAITDPQAPVGAPATYSTEDGTVEAANSYIMQYAELDEEKIQFESGYFIIQKSNVENQYFLDFGTPDKPTMMAKYYRNGKAVATQPLAGRFAITVQR